MKEIDRRQFAAALGAAPLVVSGRRARAEALGAAQGEGVYDRSIVIDALANPGSTRN